MLLCGKSHDHAQYAILDGDWNGINVIFTQPLSMIFHVSLAHVPLILLLSTFAFYLLYLKAKSPWHGEKSLFSLKPF